MNTSDVLHQAHQQRLQKLFDLLCANLSLLDERDALSRFKTGVDNADRALSLCLEALHATDA